MGGEGVVSAVHVLIAAPIHSTRSQFVLSRAHYDSANLMYPDGVGEGGYE